MRRSDELNLTLTADAGEFGILGQEPVSRMNGLSIAQFCGGNDVVVKEIAIRRRRRADAVLLVSQIEVMRIAIGLAEDGDTANAKFAASADNSQSDLSAVGYENAFKHRTDSLRKPEAASQCSR